MMIYGVSLKGFKDNFMKNVVYNLFLFYYRECTKISSGLKEKNIKYIKQYQIT